jgi:hypothetical protein
MTAIDVDVAPSGPPPVATRHDHQGLVVTTIERPAPDVIATCRSLYTALVLDHLGKHGCMTLKWTNDGDLFQIFEDSGTINVNSQASSGDTFVPAGTYTLDVNAIGSWTITITPA